MLERKPKHSTAAADAADRLRLIRCDLRAVELAVTGAVKDDDEREALVMMIRRMIGDAELLADDILTADRKQQEGRV